MQPLLAHLRHTCFQGLFFVPFDWKIKGSIMGLMHAIASFAISLFNNVLLPSTWCNKGVENERKNLEVDDVLAALPQDVSELIFMKLHFVDYVRLSAVSKSWRSIAVAARQGVNFFSSPQLPWLVLSSTKGDFPDGHHGFFSLYHGKIFTLKLPEMGGGARCCGSSFGWLIMANMVEDNFLLHPFSRLQIQLPSQRTLPSFGVISIFPTNKSIPRTDKREDALYIRKVILKSPPISFSSTSHAADNCFIVAIYALHRLCFCRPGDETWTLFQWEEPNLFEDIRWYNDRLYGIDKDFNLTILELEGSDPRGTKIDLPCPVGHDRYRQHFGFYNYLVESLGGELLLVVRCRRYPQDDNDPSNVLNPPKTFRFDVFKLGELIGGPCWIKVENLGDEMLFVGTGGGISVPATDFSSGLFKGNCIYFTDDNFTALRYIRRSKGCHDVGLFFAPFNWNIRTSITELMHTISSFAISFFNNVLPSPSTWCNKGMKNGGKNLEVDDVLVALPQDIWELIFMKLHFVDYVRLSAVSKSWRSIAAAAKQGVNFFSSPQLPWLVLSSNKGDFPDGHHRFFSLYHGKIFKLKLPEMGGGARCCGSSFGWLIMANMVEDNFLLHPFSRHQIQLPSQRTLPSFGVISIFPTNKSILRTDMREDALYIRKVILKSPPISFSSTSHAADNCFIVAIYALHRLCFCRLGDETWTLFQWEEPNLFEDIRWYNDRLYAIDKDFNLTILELEGSDPRGTKINLPCPVGHDRHRQHFEFYNYLVESLGGELLLIVRCRRYPQDDNDPSNVLNPPKTFRFDVYKLGVLIGGPCWIKVENLGDEMLFVGTGGGISVPATVFSSGLFKGNCIYFTDDNFTALRYIRRSKGCHDVGVFSLEDNSIKSFFPTDSHSPCCPPIWFVPR